MCATSWKTTQSYENVNRRAGGRRKINAERKARAQKRRDEIKELIGDDGILLCKVGRGKETMLANHFGVHRSTICRDIAALMDEWRKEHVCSICHALYTVPLKTLTKLAKRGLWDGCTTERCEKVDRIAAQHRAAKQQGGQIEK